MSSISDAENLHGVLHTELSNDRVAAAFRERGWSWRKCSWTEHEVSCGYAELVIRDVKPYLVSGEVADIESHLPEIVGILVSIGVEYEIDYEDANGKTVTISNLSA